VEAQAEGNVAVRVVGDGAFYLDAVDVQFPLGEVAEGAHGAGHDAPAQKIRGRASSRFRFFVGPVRCLSGR
jgi:hypothetical protein